MKSHQRGASLKRKLPMQLNCIPTLLLTFLAMIISMVLYAQKENPKVEEYGFYGKGGKKETKTFDYSDGGKDTIIRYFDPNGRVRQYLQTTVEKDGTVTEERTLYNCDGNKTKSISTKTDSTGARIYECEEEYDGKKGDNIIKGYKIEKTNNGTESKEFNEDTRKYEKVEVIPGPGWKNSSFEPDPSICPPEEEARMDFFAGYSHLLANFQPENEGLHGWAASAFYNFSPRWSAGIFGSAHYKSPENQKFSMYFIHAAAKFDFLGNKPENKFNPYIMGGVGIAGFNSEINIPGFPKFETDDQSFNPFIGAGFDIEAMKRMVLGVDVGYLPTHFQDDTQNNFRVTVGVGFGVFKPRRSFGDD